jgi:hypothetical protein
LVLKTWSWLTVLFQILLYNPSYVILFLISTFNIFKKILDKLDNSKVEWIQLLTYMPPKSKRAKREKLTRRILVHWRNNGINRRIQNLRSITELIYLIKLIVVQFFRIKFKYKFPICYLRRPLINRNQNLPWLGVKKAISTAQDANTRLILLTSSTDFLFQFETVTKTCNGTWNQYIKKDRFYWQGFLYKE